MEEVPTRGGASSPASISTSSEVKSAHIRSAGGEKTGSSSPSKSPSNVASLPATTGKVLPKSGQGGQSQISQKAREDPDKPAIRIYEATEAQYLNFLVYSDFGTGKTYLMATAAALPSMRDVIMLDAEAGALTLKREEEDDPYNFRSIDLLPVTNFKQVNKGYQFLKRHCMLRDANDVEGLRKLEAWVKGKDPSEIIEPRRYRTVIVDSLYEVEAYCRYQLTGVTESQAIDVEPAPEEWAEYKKNMTMISRFIRAFRDLRMNTLFTCPQQYSQDETKKRVYGPMMTGQLSSRVQGFMDVVGWLVRARVGGDDEGKMRRRLYVQPTGKFQAKCRFSAFKGDYFDDPTIETIMKAVKLPLRTPQ